MFAAITRSIGVHAPICRINGYSTNDLLYKLWSRSASKIPSGTISKRQSLKPAHLYKPRPRRETEDIDPYPNFDLSKILRPGFENSEELKNADEMVKRVFTLDYSDQDEIQDYYSQYLVKAVQRHPLDQSSYEVLIAKLTARIRMNMKYGDIDPKKIARHRAVAELQKMRNFLLNKLMEADYEVYEWVKHVLRIEHTSENPFITQVDYDDRESERMRLQEEAKNAVQAKKDQLKVQFTEEKTKFLKEKEIILKDIRQEIENLRVEIDKYNATRQQRTRTIIE